MKEIIEATNIFYEVTIVTTITDDKGKDHHETEVHLVDAPDTHDIQRLVKEQIPETLDWEITNIRKSKIKAVY